MRSLYHLTIRYELLNVLLCYLMCAGDEEALSEVGVRHVQFAAAEGMEASIPLHKALNTCK